MTWQLKIREENKKILIFKAGFQGSLHELGQVILDFRPSLSRPMEMVTSLGLQRRIPKIACVKMQSEGENLLPTLTSFPSLKMIFY